MEPDIFINTRYAKPKITVFKRSAEEEKALQIINDIKSKKIQFRPTTEKHNQIVDFLVDSVKRYDRSKILTLLSCRDVIRVYNDADNYGIVQKSDNAQIAELENTLNEKNKVIADLKTKLARFEGNDKPTDSFTSEVQEE